MKFQLRKLCRKKGDRAATRDGAMGDGVGVWSRAHSSKLKSNLQIGAVGKKYRNLAKNARILLFLFSIRGSASKKANRFLKGFVMLGGG